MQCPPMPGPGMNFMNPNGFVAAASMTSQTLTPSLSQTIAISFTRPMLTLRKVFSSSFTSSAASGDDTGTTVSMTAPAKTAMQSGQRNTKEWLLESEPAPKEIDPLMGWTSSRDTMQQVKLYFATLEEANLSSAKGQGAISYYYAAGEANTGPAVTSTAFNIDKTAPVIVMSPTVR